MDTTEDAQPVLLVCGVNGCKGTKFNDLGQRALNNFLSHEGIKSVSRINDLRYVACTECGAERTLDMQTHAKCIVQTKQGGKPDAQ